MSNMSSTALTSLTAAANREGVFEPDNAWWQQVFAVIDARDAAGFVALLTPDAQFRFGNAPTVVGSAAIGAAVSGFFRGDRLVPPSADPDLERLERRGLRGRGDLYSPRRRRGHRSLRNVFELRGTLIAVYRIFIDNSPLFA